MSLSGEAQSGECAPAMRFFAGHRPVIRPVAGILVQAADQQQQLFRAVQLKAGAEP